jgi:cellobiose-specific phosphotransferase system component IIA
VEPTINKKQSKPLFQKTVTELAQEQHDLFPERIAEAQEEIAMAHAIQKGKQGNYVTEAEIRTLLEGEP